MIKIDRSKGVEPATLGAAAALEIAENKARVEQGITRKNKLKFTAYSDAAVKVELIKIFGRKCCYCESLLKGTQRSAIEHYRPKASLRIAKADGTYEGRIGYYWLGGDWDNFLISCSDCNSTITHEHQDGGTAVSGKGTYFPIMVEEQRATCPDEILREQPILLNPCVDEPSEHIYFSEDGTVHALELGGVRSLRGAGTIELIGLHRSELVQMRARHRYIVISAIRHTVRAMEEGCDPGADLEDLLRLLKPGEPYLAYTHMLVRNYMEDYLEMLGLDEIM